MYCPNCGAHTSTEQKFCRSCGLGLEKIALSLTEQLPARLDENLISQKERFERIGVAALSVCGAGILTALLFGIIYKVMIQEGKLLSGLAMLGVLSLICLGLFAVFMFAKAREAEEAASKRRIPRVETIPTKELLPEGNFEPVPSVTDRTTELLSVEKSSTHGR